MLAPSLVLAALVLPAPQVPEELTFGWSETIETIESPSPLSVFTTGLATRNDGAEVHLTWQNNPQVSTSEGFSFYEVRSAETGAVLHQWGFFESLVNVPWGISADGSRFAGLFEVSFDEVLELRDTTDGAVVASFPIDDLFGSTQDAGLAWDPDGSDVVVAWRTFEFFEQALRVARYGPNGQLRWEVELSDSDASDVREVQVFVEPETGHVLVSRQVSLDFDRGLRVDRLAASNGSSLGRLTWDDPEPVVSIDVELRGLNVEPLSAQAYLVVESRVGSPSGGDQTTVVRLDLDSMVAVDERVVLPESFTAGFGPGDLSPDGSRLVLSGRGDLPGAGVLAPSRMDVLELPSLETRYSIEQDEASPIAFAQARFLDNERIAVAHGGSVNTLNPSAKFNLVNADNGISLARVSDDEGLLLTSIWEVSAGGLVFFGRSDPQSESATLETLGIAPLLAGPNSVSATDGALDFAVDAGPQFANELFLVVGSVTGVAPATVVDGIEVPIVFDAYTRATVTRAGSGPFVQMLGLLDGDGVGDARLQLPASSLVPPGIELFHAAVVITNGGQVAYTTQPVASRVVD